MAKIRTKTGEIKVPDRQLAVKVRGLIEGLGEVETQRISELLAANGIEVLTRFRSALANGVSAGLLRRTEAGRWTAA